MKKITLLIITIFTLSTAHSNPVVDALNRMHKISNRYWKHQKIDPLDMYSRAWQKKGFIAPTREEDPNSDYLDQRRTDLPPFRIGGAVEGIGELADIATLTLAYPKLIRLANILALTSRVSDVALGSFPELLRKYVDSQGNPITPQTAQKRQIPLHVEKSALRFWPKLWQQDSGNERISLYLAVLALNQTGKALDIKRAIDRYRHANLLAWYHARLTKKQRLRLHVEQVVHAALLLGGLIIKRKQEDKDMEYRYPWLTAEAVMSFIRRWRMRQLQQSMLDDARVALAQEKAKEQKST